MSSQQTYALGPFEESIAGALQAAQANRLAERLWKADTGLWSGRDENRWVGWLHIVDQQREQAAAFRSIAQEIRQAGFTDVLLLGMGGSSLCPEVMRMTFGVIAGYPALHVLDSTVPAQVAAFEKAVDLKRTLCIVASKSGSTTEPNVFRDYFYDRMGQAVGADRAGQHFIAITDPGSLMEQDARQKGFRHIFYGVPEIGGRYSALSHFGMIPSAVMGVDVPALLDRTAVMVRRCGPSVPAGENPGLALGIVLGELARAGRDKVTVIPSPTLWDLGAWMEQLIAESTGKQGKGLVPIDGESLGSPEVYGDDRVFAYIRLASAPDPAQDRAVEALEAAGHPVVRLTMHDPLDIGAEFFRWEFATAVAGHVLGINPFDQPNVQESKDYTKNLTDAYERTGSLPAEKPVFEADGIALITDEANASDLAARAAASGFPKDSLEAWIAAHTGRIRPGDYAAINAYVEMNAGHTALIQAIRHRLRDTKRVATTVGYGPRFLHSTGQLHKGGPNTGVFFQVTCDDARDVAIPGKRFSFGVLKAAQATGDFLALSSRSRRLLRVHLPADVPAGLARLKRAIEAVTG
jgi:transaldolase/glucose-6-phosphate isomerase